ncbi:MAG: MgtC/SapB family protein [Candidatus Krumholzibacteriota bacterium]|nr:MgtC/SapB family protein [Candidatus Krumholzibacteriota bacterium]
MQGSLFTFVLRLLISLAVGGIVGLERELQGKPAGIRTNMLMCFGSCLIMIVSLEVARLSQTPADPGRIAAQVITGVGFLCAGTIIRSRFSVSGLTTAATIWVLSALGLCIGAGCIVLSLVGACLVTLTLILLRQVETALRRFHSNHIVQLIFDAKEGMIGSILQVFSGLKVVSETLDLNLTGNTWSATFEYEAPRKKHALLMKDLSALEGVQNVTEMRHTF